MHTLQPLGGAKWDSGSEFTFINASLTLNYILYIPYQHNYGGKIVCCKCNKTCSCKGCACVKAGNKCFNCLPGKIGHCSNATIVVTTSHEVAAATIARQSAANISTSNVSLCTTLATSSHLPIASQSNTCSPSSSSQSSQPIDECRQSPAPPNDATEATQTLFLYLSLTIPYQHPLKLPPRALSFQSYNILISSGVR